MIEVFDLTSHMCTLVKLPLVPSFIFLRYSHRCILRTGHIFVFSPYSDLQTPIINVLYSAAARHMPNSCQSGVYLDHPLVGIKFQGRTFKHQEGVKGNVLDTSKTRHAL